MALGQNRKIPTVIALILAFAIVSVGAQAIGATKTTSSAELLCIEPKSNHVIHPTSTKCPKGYSKLVLNAQGLQGIPGVQSEVGAQGAQGIQGIQGLIGATGATGINGSTILQGTTTLTNEMGVNGDFYFNSALKLIYGPKAKGFWPEGVSLAGGSGPTGAAGPAGSAGAAGPAGSAGATGATGATGAAGGSAITELLLCDGSDAGTVADEKCKVGMTGPGAGIIFFVDYYDQYSGFNYLEAAPSSCVASKQWSSDQTHSVTASSGWSGRAVGTGKANTTAMLTSSGSYVADTSGAAFHAHNCAAGSKSDWFLPSVGEMALFSQNAQGLGSNTENSYWTSSQWGSGDATLAYTYSTDDNALKSFNKNLSYYQVMPVRSF